MKKNIVCLFENKIIILFILFLFLLVLFCFNLEIKQNVEKDKNNFNVLSEVENKAKLLLYVTDDLKKCDLCKEINLMIDYYCDIYDLNFLYFDKSKNSDKEYNKLLKKIKVANLKFESPNIMLIEDKNLIFSTNGYVSENSFKQFLVDYNFIDEKYMNSDNDIEDEEFKKIFSSSDKSLILFYSGSSSDYDYRKKIFEFSEKFDFDFYVIKIGFGFTTEALQVIIDEGLSDKLPLLVVVKDSKIIDYTTNRSNSKIEDFLKDNKFIK